MNCGMNYHTIIVHRTRKSHWKWLSCANKRCISLTSEGGLSNACKALVSPPPVSHTAEITNILVEKHPPATFPVTMSAFGNASGSSVPLADVDITERCINSFHRLSGGGPSGLRPIHLKNCLSTEYRDEVSEMYSPYKLIS